MSKKRYWLRGAIITSIVFALSYILIYYFGEIYHIHQNAPGQNDDYVILWLGIFYAIQVLKIIVAPAYVVGIFFMHGNELTNILIISVLSLPLYFALGSFLGFVYGKLRGHRVS